MAYDIGPRIGIDGEAEFRQQISQINARVKTLGTEMKVVTSAFIGQEKSVESLSAQNEVLGRTVSALEDKLAQEQAMLQKSTEAYGEADARTQKWQQAVNRTQAEINKANAKIEENSRELEDNGKTVEDTAQKHEGAMSRIGSATVSAMQVAGAALAAGAAAVAALAKQSLDLYGDYEQLTGGVETLFKDSSSQVMEYANNAYKMAGLSANEYMESVTGFSAALLQSLWGDTQAAAKTADRALTDMADNANKMGTSMDAIQNAYQGFAKQNYTMLDNLKLGYGGTKEEMERLLRDAQALSGVEYDINSFADIVEAIHVVQTEMGITGTTALEASQTIQGSTAAMKAAWTNLLAGLGDQNANLEQLVGNLVESVQTMLGNLIPVVTQVLSGIGQAVVDLAPVISTNLPAMVEQVLPALMEAAGSLLLGLSQGLLTALPQLVPVAMEIIGTLITNLTEMAPGLITGAVAMITSLADGLSESLPVLLPLAADMIVSLAEGLTDPDSLTGIASSAVKLIVSLAEGLVAAIPKLLTAAPVIVTNLLKAVTSPDLVPQIFQAALNVILSLVSGLIEAAPQLFTAGADLLNYVLSGISSLFQKVKDIGANIVSGVWEGIKGMANWFADKVKGFFSGIVESVMELLGIHSPSTVFAGIGQNMAAGLGAGWDKAYKDVERDIMRGLDFPSPTISPALDMPGITAGRRDQNLAGLMEGMVNGIQTATAGSGPSLPNSATIILPAADGTVLARWILPDLRAAMRDDPDPADA